MKLWEAMKLLEEDASRKFEYKNDRKKWVLYADVASYDDLVFYMLDCWDSKGELRTGDGFGNFYGNLSTSDNWQLVRQPVTWQEAIEAWGTGKIVSVEVGGCKFKLTHDDTIFGLSERMINLGIWYVEDVE